MAPENAQSNFSFGSTSTPAASKPVGLALPSTATPASSSTGFSVGATPGAPAAGLSFGATPTAAPTPTSALGNLLTATTVAAAPPAYGGFGAPQAKTATPGFGGLGTPATATTSAGFGLGGTSFGAAAPVAAPGFGGLAAKPAAAPTATSTGFAFGGFAGAATAARPALSLTGTSVPSSTGFGLGGLTASTAASGGIFGTGAGSASTDVSRGLGGLDPKTSTIAAGSTDKTSESKVVKESQVLPEICHTVDETEKFVRAQKDIREKSARKSSKPLYKVQENIASMKQSLHLVSNHLQRNRIEIEKLKTKSAQDLKHVEISQRTNETPPGLQYENTAPIGYFIQLVEEFETNMINYRQQIEDMELHLTSVGQSNSFTPQELSLLLRKLHESFMALAAHLQVVHESVKTQKEHFLNYRQIFHGDSADVFEQRRKYRAANVRQSTGTAAIGPTPFSGVTNQVASAMATALNQPQQPAAPSAYGTGAFGTQPTNTTGLFGTGTGASGFGTTFKPATTGFGASTTFGFGSSSAGTARPLTTGFAFGSASAATSFNTPGTAGGFANNSFGQNAANQQAFQLSKPPVGNKRGKKA